MSSKVHDAVVSFVEPPEVLGSKEDGPESFADLLEAEVLKGEKLGDPNEMALPADHAELRASVLRSGRDS